MKSMWKKIPGRGYMKKGSSFSDLPISAKLLCLFLILVVLPLTIFGTVINSVMSNTTYEQMRRSSKQDVDQAVINIDKELQELDNITLSFQWTPAIQGILRSNFSKESLLDRKTNAEKVSEQLQVIANSRLDVELMYLMRTDYEEFSLASSNDAQKLLNGFWNQRDSISELAKEAKGRMNWVRLNGDAPFILGIRDIYDAQNLNKIGLVVIGISDEQLNGYFENLRTTPGSVYAIVDDNGRQIFSTNPVIGSLPLDKAIDAGQSWNKALQGYHLAFEKSAYTHWTIVQASPHNEIISSTRITRYILLGVMCFSLGILIFILKVFSNSLVLPIKDLMVMMNKVKREDFTAYAEETRKDEFGELALVFNSMVRKIQSLIEEDYKKRLLVQEAEYKYLRAQINPHFIYNTLDCINWMAMQTGSRDISRVTVALGRLLRRSILGKTDVTDLRDEVDGLKDYITIQKMRYGDRLTVDLQIADDTLGLTVTRSILQPMVENALVHGIEKKPGAGQLCISAQKVQEMLHIMIEDDGIGMTPERIEQVLSGHTDESVGAHTGVGIYNVHKRLQLLFGEQYGIRIESEASVGTRMLLSMPAIEYSEYGKGAGTHV